MIVGEIRVPPQVKLPSLNNPEMCFFEKDNRLEGARGGKTDAFQTGAGNARGGFVFFRLPPARDRGSRDVSFSV